jgi:hypothetical protein
MRWWLDGCRSFIEVIQNPFHDRRVFDTGDHLDGAAALFTGFDIDFEQASSPKADFERSVP